MIECRVKQQPGKALDRQVAVPIVYPGAGHYPIAEGVVVTNVRALTEQLLQR